MKGIIVKGIAGFYYVKTPQSVVECKARGIFKNRGITPLVGDEVEISPAEEGKGVIETIHPRRNEFIRPPVANIDCFVITIAAAKPKPNLFLVDRFLVMAAHSGTDAVVAVNKCDLADDGYIDEIAGIYEGVYDVIRLSMVGGTGIDDLKEATKGRRVAFAGPSGVGKSTIINTLVPEAGAETGDISRKTRRGKHTTRHVEMFEYNGGFIFDTPGFTSFDILEADESELSSYFPEMIPYLGCCQFDDCRHINEPGCAVKKAVEDGLINSKRYESYVSFMNEIMTKKEY